MIRPILLGATAATAAGLLFVNVYNSVVDAPNWGAQLPHSIEAALAYFTVTNPGTFFRIASPLNQILSLLGVILCWRNNRYIAIGVLISAVLADVITFSYFYPRNAIMFEAPIDESAVRTAWEQWSSMNWVRSTVCLCNTVLAFILLLTTTKKTIQ